MVEEKTTLISTFYSVAPFMPAAHAYSPAKMILLVDNLNDEVKENIEHIKKTFSNVAQIEVVKTDRGDIYADAKKTIELLEREHKENARIIVNISGGWKLLAQAVLYGCYARADFVNKIVCNNLDNNDLIELPIFMYGLTNPKRTLLEEIQNRNGRTIQEIAKKLGRTKGMIYLHLRELKKQGYIDDQFKITIAGKLALI